MCGVHVLYYTILYCTILYYTVLYCTILYYTVLYCTILYYTVLSCSTGTPVFMAPELLSFYIAQLQADRCLCNSLAALMIHQSNSTEYIRNQYWLRACGCSLIIESCHVACLCSSHSIENSSMKHTHTHTIYIMCRMESLALMFS